MRLLSPIILLASLCGQVAAQDPAADPRAPERVLASAGLTPLSNSYVLSGEIEAIRTVDSIRLAEERLTQILDRIRSLESRYNSEQREYEALRRPANDLRRRARELRYRRDERGQPTHQNEADRLEDDARDIEFEADQSSARRAMDEAERAAAPFFRARDATAQEIQRLQFTYRNLVAETLRRYAVVGADPQVKAALRALNKGRQPKLALGPLEAYQQNVVRASQETLAALGLHEERGVYIQAQDEKFIERVSAADLLRREVAMHERRLKEPQAPEDSRKIAGLLAERRAMFAQRLLDLRHMADAILAQQRDLARDVEVLDALAEINRVRSGRTGLGTKPGFKNSLQKLEEMEAGLPTEPNPPEREGDSEGRDQPR